MPTITVDIPSTQYTLPDGSTDSVASVLVDAFAFQFDFIQQQLPSETKAEFALRMHKQALRRIFREYILYLKSQTISGVEDVDPGIEVA